MMHSYSGLQSVQTATKKKNNFMKKLKCVGNKTESTASLFLGLTMHVMLSRNDNLDCNNYIINMVFKMF